MYQFKKFFNAVRVKETPSVEYRANLWARDNDGKIEVVAVSYFTDPRDMEYLVVCYRDLEMEDHLLSDEEWADQQETLLDAVSF